MIAEGRKVKFSFHCCTAYFVVLPIVVLPIVVLLTRGCGFHSLKPRVALPQGDNPGNL